MNFLLTCLGARATGTYRMGFRINGSKHVMDTDEIHAKRILDAINDIRAKV